MSAHQSRGSLQDKPLWLLIGALLFVGGVTFWTARSLIQTRQATEDEIVIPPPQQVSVAALGRIEPQGRVVDVATSENGRLDRLLVNEGDQVKAGDILAYLDLYSVRLAERDYAASQLSEAQALLEAETSAGQAQIQETVTRIGQLDRPQAYAIDAQKAAVESLRAELNLAKLDLNRTQQLYQQGAIAEQDLDRQRATVDRLTQDLENAIATQLRLETNRTADLDNAIAQVGTAEANMQRSQVDVKVDSAARNLALAESRLELTLVRAPQNGQILQIFAEPGEAVSTTNPLMALGNTDQMTVVAEVYESDVGLVEVDQKATITSRNGAFEETLVGTVEQIGLQIFKNDVLDDDPAANADARVVEVRIRIEQSDVVKQLTNLQVDVVIDIES
ncbi:MAG: efflux RND transporter periplasmic adaptor subunit [Cyanobacteria bacterium P01_A01_bin.123]